jgi:RNA polymerase sigma-70 factor (ECF subfamily)
MEIPSDRDDAHAHVEQLYLAHQRPITAYLARVVGDRHAAEDLCQETFIKALRAWAQHDQHSSVVSWLYRIATNTAYDSLRRSRTQRWASLDVAHAATADGEDDLVASTSMRTALERLPTAYRMPLMLASGGYTASEMAGALRCSPTAIRMRLHRARARLRQAHDDGV